MRINKRYKLREIAGENVIVNQGIAGGSLTRIISLNASAKILFTALSGKDFELADAADVLMENYEGQITRETAVADAAKWVEALKENGVITD